MKQTKYKTNYETRDHQLSKREERLQTLQLHKIMIYVNLTYLRQRVNLPFSDIKANW